MKNKYKVIAIIGPSGSGKDTIVNKMIDYAPSLLHRVIHYTTRPRRDGEVDGKDYFFYSNEDLAKRIIDGKVYSAAFFNEWCYAVGPDSFSEDKVNIGVFSPADIEMLKTKDFELYVFYVEAAEHIRLMRQLGREKEPDVDEIIRRLYADREDFFKLDFYYNEIWNENNKDLQDCVESIMSACIKLAGKINQEKEQNRQ